MSHREKVLTVAVGVNVYAIGTAAVFHFAPDLELWQKLVFVPAALVGLVMVGIVLLVVGG